jgi:hypothetical protein
MLCARYLVMVKEHLRKCLVNLGVLISDLPHDVVQVLVFSPDSLHPLKELPLVFLELARLLLHLFELSPLPLLARTLCNEHS